MSGVKLSILGLLLLSAPALGVAGQRTVGPVTRDAAPVFSSGVDMVTVNVSVRDPRGRIVRGLACRDFRLVDSGFGRPIRSVFESDAPLRIAVLLDMSGSMAIDGNIVRARRAVRTVVGALQSGRDEAALFAFDSALREIVPFTRDLARFDALDLAGRPYGRTSLYDAVADTAALVGRSGDRHGALLVVTDGVDTGSRRTVEEVSGGRERHRRAGASAHGGRRPRSSRRAGGRGRVRERRAVGDSRGPRELDRGERTRDRHGRGYA